MTTISETRSDPELDDSGDLESDATTASTNVTPNPAQPSTQATKPVKLATRGANVGHT